MLTWGWIIQITLISIILIFLVHHLLIFFKSVLTVPKVKDLVNTPTQKYESMFKAMTRSDDVRSEKEVNYSANDTTSIKDILDMDSMKNELKDHLQHLSFEASDTFSTFETQPAFPNKKIKITDLF